MSLLCRYVMRAVLGYTLLVMSVFIILAGSYLFVMEQDEIGIGNYRMADALVWVACNIPRQVFDLLPIGALIGSLLALGNFSRLSELVVMRAAGVSVFRLAGWVSLSGIVLMIFTGVLGDYVAPPLEQFAQQQKTLAKFNEFSATEGKGMWAKDGNTFISVQKQSGDVSFGGVYVLKFDDKRRLTSVARADSAVGRGSELLLRNYVATQFIEGGTRAIKQKSEILKTNLSPEFLATDPDVLTGSELYAYIRYLRGNRLDTREYETTLWARMARTAAIFVIVVLAVPFAFGPMRSTGAGARTVIGILIGATFFFMAKLLENGGAVFDLHPLVIAWGPTAVLTVATAIALSRVR